MPTYKIRVNTKDEGEYRLMTAYDVDASNRHDAEKKARQRFCNEFGFEYSNTESYVLHNETVAKEDFEYLRAHGLPDEIPS